MSCVPPGWSIDPDQLCEDRSTGTSCVEWLGSPPGTILHGVNRTPSPHLADALADRYTIERELGRGGMATVYLAQEHKHAAVLAELEALATHGYVSPVAVATLGGSTRPWTGPSGLTRSGADGSRTST
jgi:hypothetical protein